MKNKHLLYLITIFLTIIGNASAFFGENNNYTIEATSPYSSIKPGGKFYIITTLKLNQNWYTYYKIPGETGEPFTLEWEIPKSVKLTKINFPAPKVKAGPTYYYNDKVTFLSEFTLAPGTPETNITLTQLTSVQTCTTGSCLFPDKKEIPISIDVREVTLFKANGELSLTHAQNHLPTKIAQENINTTVSDDSLKIYIKTSEKWGNLKNLYFIPDQKSNLNLKTGTTSITAEEDGYTLTYQLPPTHNAATHISGVITSKNGRITNENKAYFISHISQTPQFHAVTPPPITAPKKPTSEQTASAHTETFEWSDKDKAEHAKLYNVDEKIKFTASGDAATEETSSLFTILAFAFIGGAILNLMPCVFPVLGLKIMGFVMLSGNDPKKIKLHGIIFTLGVLISMWILAIALLIIRESTAISWGQQMGNPIFVGCIVILLFALGLNMYGVFDFGTSLTSAGGNLQNKKGYSGSFFSGILTTLIATPCSGPFLGATMGYTLQQPAITALLIFTVFALGVASPYIILSFSPKLINKLPKPGGWMEVFKKVMAFPLFATCVFFLRAFSGQTGLDGAFWLSMGLVLLGMAAWAYGTWSPPSITKNKRFIWGMGFPLLILSTAIWMFYTGMNKQSESEVKSGWQAWHPGLAEHHVSKKRVVWVDYTADW